jgi:hypothetical protein
MERMTPDARQNDMMDQRQIRGLAVAALLCAALAGCGSVAASSSAAAPAADGTHAGTTPAGTAPADTASGGVPTAAPLVGCASVNQATTVMLHSVMRLMVPVGKRAFIITEHKPALVRALFGDICNAVTHPVTATGPVNCPAAFGIKYTGAFFDGTRVLATFTYFLTGCQRVSITADGKTQATMVLGRAAAAAPHLMADMDAVLGFKPGIMQPYAPVSQG